MTTLFLVWLFSVGGICTQSSVDPSLIKIEVASIKLNASGGLDHSINIDGPRFTATNESLKRLILKAYDLQEFEVIGGPNWMDTDRFDIIAKSEVNPRSMDDARRIQQLLLEDRFQLRVHREMKEMPVYALVVGKNGAKLKQSHSTSGGLGMSLSKIDGTGITLIQLATALSTRLGHRVVDKTGIDGKFDISLAWRPDTADAAADSSAPSIFTVVEEQLGLRVESGRRAVEVLVVDSAQKPRPN